MIENKPLNISFRWYHIVFANYVENVFFARHWQRLAWFTLKKTKISKW